MPCHYCGSERMRIERHEATWIMVCKECDEINDDFTEADMLCDYTTASGGEML